MEEKKSTQTRRIPVSLRRLVTPQTIRMNLLKPILNIARFFVGDSIPRISDAEALYDEIKSQKKRGIEVSKANTVLLTKLIAILIKAKKGDDEMLLEGLQLLSGLILYVIEDDYFFIPVVTEHASHEKLKLLALKLVIAHSKRSKKLIKTVEALNLSFNSVKELRIVEDGLPPYMQSKELVKTICKLRVHLGEGEEIFNRHQDPERIARHRERLSSAYIRSTNLLARLLAIPASADHKKLRRRIISRELRMIELDALGVEYISETEQHDQAEKLLAQTESDFGQSVTSSNKDELALRVKEMQAEIAQEASSDSALDEGWFFDMN